MTSIFERALGQDYARLHPALQRRLALSSEQDLAQVGNGVMTNMARGRLAALPVLALGRARRLELPGAGTDVRFELANYSYLDTLGRETFAYSRRFHVGSSVRKFDDTMIFSDRRQRIVNYLGSHQDLAAELICEVTETGGIRMRGAGQRVYAGQFHLRLPTRVAAAAEVVETWDEERDRFTISVDITSAAGLLFGYRGWFKMTEVPCLVGAIPDGVRPDKERLGD
ncbi:MAG: hypothetical protein JWO63_1470 [Frankiales bacterium]|nr:hypothetical protein [Frankiales bacterium]